MFGIHDIWIILAYVLCILSAILCVVYGIVNWNKGPTLSQMNLPKNRIGVKTNLKLKTNYRRAAIC